MDSRRILLTAGSNAKGQLGIGSYDDAHTFTPCQFTDCEPNHLPDPTATVTQIACGANHTVLLFQHFDGPTTLWGAGDGRKGQLGPGYSHREPHSAPWTVFHRLDSALRPCSAAPGESYASRGYKCKHVAAAWETTYVALSRPGSSDVLLSMGSNDFGALGADSEGGADAPAGSSATRRTGAGGAGSSGGEPRVVDVDHLFPDGSRSGRPAPPRTLCVRSLHAGPRHVVAQLVMTNADGPLSSQTVLAGWGASRHGQLGQNGGVRFVARPIRLPIDIDDDPMVSCALGNQHTVVLHESGRMSALGSNKQGQIPSLGSRKRICRLGCTWNGTYMQAIDDDKQVLFSTGNGAQGQLGRGDTAEYTSAVDATVRLPVDGALSSFVCGSEHVLAAMSSLSQQCDSVVGWGWNEHGNMGLGSLGNITIPTQLWPRGETYDKYPQRVIGIWAGCATSWLLVE